MTSQQDTAARSMGRSVGLNLVGAAVSAVATLGVTVALTRTMTQSVAGTIFSTTSVFLIAGALAQFGAQTGLVYFLPRAEVAQDRKQARGWVTVALVPTLIAAAAIGIAGIVWREPLGRVLSGHGSGAGTFLAILALGLPFLVLEQLLLAACRGAGRMRAYVLVELVARPALQLALVLGVASSPMGRSQPGWVVFAWVAPYLLAAVASARAVVSVGRAQQWPSRGADARGLAGPFWRYTSPRGLTALSQVVMQRVDVVLVGVLAGPVQAAVYLAATRFIVLGQLAANVMTMASQPVMSRALAAGDVPTSHHVFRQSTAWLMALAWPLYLVLAIHGSDLLRVFGSKYSIGNMVLVVLAVAMLFSTAVGMVDMVLTMSGRTTWTLLNSSAALATMIALDVALIPTWGASGAAVAWAVAIVLRNLLALAQVWRSQGLHAFDLNALAIGVLAIACFGVVGLAARLLPLSGVVALAVSVVFGGAGYLIGLYLLRDRLQLQELLRWRRRGLGTG